MTRLSLRVQPAERVSIRTDRGRQGETGPAGYAVPIDGLTILANPLSDEAPPIAVNAEEARALIDAVSPSALQSALAAWLPALPRTIPAEPNMAWIDGDVVKVSAAWIFSGGVWDDAGNWVDSQIWSDN